MKHESWRLVVLDRLLELAMVFIGVYAAFCLTNYQEQQVQRERHRHLIVYLEKEAASNAARDREKARVVDQDKAEMSACIEQGTIPEVKPITWPATYVASEFGSLFQAGDLSVLDLRTIARMREVDAITRTGYALMSNYQQLVNQLLVLHSNQPQDYFYEPATKQLRRPLTIYVDALEAGSHFLHQLSDADDRLLAELSNERERFARE